MVFFNAKLHFTGEKKGSLHLSVEDINGKALLEKKEPIQSTVKIKNEVLKDVHLWNNHDPYLYQLITEIYDEQGKLLEVIPYQFGS